MGGDRSDEEPTDADDDRPDSDPEHDAAEPNTLGGDGTSAGTGAPDSRQDEVASEEPRDDGSSEGPDVEDDTSMASTEDQPAESTEDEPAEPTGEESDDVPDDEGPAELEDIDSVGSSRADALREAGYESVDDVRRASADELSNVDGIGSALATRIQTDVDDGTDVTEEPRYDAEFDDSDSATAGLLDNALSDDEPLLSGPNSDQEMPLTDHIEEMVKRLAVVVAIAGAVSLVTFPFAEYIINFLWYNIMPGVPGDIARPRLYGVLELLFTKLKVASLAGLIIALPVLVYETYQFMRPGLYPHERRYYLAAIPASLVLALVGVSFAYFVVLPAIFTYFLAYSQDVATIGFALGRTFDLILALMGYLALVFQIPLFIMLAMMMGLVTRQWLADRRLLFWGAFLGVSFIFSPDPTGMAPVLIALTMVGLFEGTLLLTKWAGRK